MPDTEQYYADIFMTQWRNYQHLRVLCRYKISYADIGITREIIVWFSPSLSKTKTPTSFIEFPENSPSKHIPLLQNPHSRPSCINVNF